MDRYEQLIDSIVETGHLKTPRIIEAFKSTPRIEYLPDLYKRLHCVDAPLPISHKQTASQPLVIAFMLELLQPAPGENVLEIGYGSGWQTALLAKLVCPPKDSSPKTSDRQSPPKKHKCGAIHAYEIVPEVADFGKSNIKSNLPPRLQKIIHINKHDYAENFSKFAPYDKIIAGAAFQEIPEDLIESLSIGGIMVYPTKVSDIRKITRSSDEKYSEEVYPGFVFVPIRH